jgi:uncharacterized protein
MTVIADLNSARGLARIRCLCWAKLLFVIVIFGLLSTQATAASFDCNKAVSWVEKTVCSNPELSKLDEEMAKAYHDALASLSSEGQKETKQCQKQWLKEISYIKAEHNKIVSEDKYFSASDSDKFSVDDLKDAYKERITQFNKILIKFPDRIFRNVHVSYSEALDTCRWVYVKKELTYPQIENPRDESEKFWNTLIFKKAIDAFRENTEDKCTNVNDKYTVSFSNKHLISIQSAQFYIEHGQAHGYTNVTSFSWLLGAKRELQASDLFDDKTGWRNKLATLVSRQLKEEEESYEIKPFDLMDRVTSPSQWMISKEGLGIQFGEYAFGGRSAPFFITIDWKTLDLYLSRNGHSLIYE